MIEKIPPKNSFNYGIKEIKSIEFCIEFLISNNKTVYDNLDDTQQINALIQWNLEINLPKFHHPQRNYSLNTTLLIQKSNLVKVLPIIEVSYLVSSLIQSLNFFIAYFIDTRIG